MKLFSNLTMAECTDLGNAMKSDGFVYAGGYGDLAGMHGTHSGNVYRHPDGAWFHFDYLHPFQGEPRGSLDWREERPMTDLERCVLVNNH